MFVREKFIVVKRTSRVKICGEIAGELRSRGQPGNANLADSAVSREQYSRLDGVRIHALSTPALHGYPPIRRSLRVIFSCVRGLYAPSLTSEGRALNHFAFLIFL